MGVGQNVFAVDYHAGAFDLLGAVFGPRPEQIGRMMDGVNLYDEVANAVLSAPVRGARK
jgi:hypothetical protein